MTQHTGPCPCIAGLAVAVGATLLVVADESLLLVAVEVDAVATGTGVGTVALVGVGCLVFFCCFDVDATGLVGLRLASFTVVACGCCCC